MLSIRSPTTKARSFQLFHPMSHESWFCQSGPMGALGTITPLLLEASFCGLVKFPKRWIAQHPSEYLRQTLRTSPGRSLCSLPSWRALVLCPINFSGLHFPDSQLCLLHSGSLPSSPPLLVPAPKARNSRPAAAGPATGSCLICFLPLTQITVLFCLMASFETIVRLFVISHERVNWWLCLGQRMKLSVIINGFP